MVITRKIELEVIEKKDKTWEYLRNLSYLVFRSANLIISHQWVNESIRERIILNDDELRVRKEKLDKSIKVCRDKEKLKKLELKRKTLNKDCREKVEQLLTTGEKNSTYQLIRRKFPEISSYIVAALNDQICKTYSKNKSDIKKGRRAISNYRYGLPILFMKDAIKFVEKDNDIFITWVNGIKFKIKFGRDHSNNKIIVQRILEKEYNLCDSSIKIEKTKIFLNLTLKIPNKNSKLNNDLSVGVDLGITIPAYCALSKGLQRLSIGSSYDLLRVRQQFQARRRNLQKSLELTRGGHGRTDKLKSLDSLKKKERDYVRTYNHMISKKIIDFTLKNNAGIIKLEFLKGFSKNESNNFILRNWSYFELQKFIEYKAQFHGIDVVYVDPYHTSQICAECGELGERRTQSKFYCINKKCKNYGIVINADYNGALNIAKSLKIISNIRECEYYKIRMKELTLLRKQKIKKII